MLRKEEKRFLVWSSFLVDENFETKICCCCCCNEDGRGGGDSQSANEQCRRVCRQQEYKIISSSKIVENEKQDLSRVQNTSGCHSEVYLATSLNALVNNKE
jgi:hypothetical protein